MNEIKNEKEVINKENETEVVMQENETLFSWLFSQGKNGMKNLPSMAKTLSIQIGIIVLIQVVFWWREVSQYIPDIIKWPVVFLTSTYNDIIPKTLYWIIIFTFGKKLFNRIRKTGFKKAMRPIKWLIPEFKKTMNKLQEKSFSLLLFGGGIGLIVANNFASYSRFSGARNKFDKYFIAILISFTVAYILGETKKHWLFKFFRLTASDIARLFKKKSNFIDDYTYLLLSGFVIGLILDAPIILLKIKYGGYYLGILFIILSVITKIVLMFKRGVKNVDSK